MIRCSLIIAVSLAAAFGASAPPENDGGLIIPLVTVEGRSTNTIRETYQTNGLTVRERTEAYRKLAPADQSSKYDTTNAPPERGVAEFFARYGSYNALDAAALFGKDFGMFNYLVSFMQYRSDGIGSNGSLYANSDENRTKLSVNVSGSAGVWLGNLFFSFNSYRTGLFDDPFLLSQKRHALTITARNDIFFSEKGALTHTLTGSWGQNAFDPRITTNAPASMEIRGDEYTVDTALLYDHLFSEENYLLIKVFYSYQRHVGGFAEDRWLTGITASDGIAPLPWLYLSLGITLSYASDSVFSWYPLVLVRATPVSAVSFFLRYDGADSLVPFASRYVDTTLVCAQSTNATIDHIDTAEAGMEVKIPDTLRFSLAAFARGLRVNDSTVLTTNAALVYSYAHARESAYGAALNGELFLGQFAITLAARYTYYPVSSRYDLYPALDANAAVSYTNKAWGLTVKAAVPFAVGASHGQPMFYWYPYLEAEQAFSESIALNLKIDNIFDMNMLITPLYPRSGREYHIGLRVRL